MEAIARALDSDLAYRFRVADTPDESELTDPELVEAVLLAELGRRRHDEIDRGERIGLLIQPLQVQQLAGHDAEPGGVLEQIGLLRPGLERGHPR